MNVETSGLFQASSLVYPVISAVLLFHSLTSPLTSIPKIAALLYTMNGIGKEEEDKQYHQRNALDFLLNVLSSESKGMCPQRFAAQRKPTDLGKSCHLRALAVSTSWRSSLAIAATARSCCAASVTS